MYLWELADRIAESAVWAHYSGKNFLKISEKREYVTFPDA